MSVTYPKCKKKWMTNAGGPDLDADDIRIMLVKNGYVYNAAHQFLSDVGAGNDNGRTAALTGKVVGDDATFDADDTTLNAVAAAASNALIAFKHTGNDATAELIAYIDDAVGLPFTPEAAQVCPIVWSGGINKIFTL